MAQKRVGVMSADIDYDKATIKIPNQAPVVLVRPLTVSVSDWFGFWGGSEPEATARMSTKTPAEMHDAAVQRHREYMAQ